ncbi:MAG: two-component regulator propeller domain-containing protein [Bacteroidota bacterium]
MPSLLGQRRSPFTEYFDIENGLSQNSINEIVYDSTGFLWFGTKDGLNRFDGYEFKVYRRTPKQANTISGNHILAAVVLADGRMVVSCKNGGLDLYNPYADNFSSLLDSNQQARAISQFLSMPDGQVWFISQNAGLGSLSIDPEEIKPLFCNIDPLADGDPNWLKTEELYWDNRGKLWVATAAGVYSVKIEDGDKLELKVDKAFRIPSASHVLSDKEGNVYINSSLEEHSLYVYDKKLDSLFNFSSQVDGRTLGLIKGQEDRIVLKVEKDSYPYFLINYLGRGDIFIEQTPNRLPINSTKFFLDPDKNLWIGTDGDGIIKYTPRKTVFKSYPTKPNHPLVPENASTRAIYVNYKGEILQASYKGNFIYSPDQKKVRRLKDEFGLQEKLLIYSIYQDPDDPHICWIGAEGKGGLGRLDWRKNTLEFYCESTKSLTPASCLDRNTISCFLKLDPSSLLVGTELGLFKLDIPSGQLSKISADATQASFISCLLKDQQGIIWVGTHNHGLLRYQSETQTLAAPPNIENSSQDILSLYAGDSLSPHTLWIGTNGNGLVKQSLIAPYHKVNYNYEAGHPDGVIYGIIQDRNRSLWTSSNHGICRFDISTEQFSVYDKSNGLLSSEFNKNSFLNDLKNDRIFFGGTQGLNSINPQSVRVNPRAPNISILNPKVLAPDKAQIQEDLAGIINIPAKQFSINIKMVSLSFTRPDKNQYAYRLESQGNSWEYLGHSRQLSIANLSPGKHYLRIKGANEDGIWDKQGKKYLIVKQAFFWQKSWVQIIGLSIILGLIYLFYLAHQRRKKNLALRIYNQSLEETVSQRTNQLQEQEVFLRNILSNLPGLVYRLKLGSAYTPIFLSDASQDILGISLPEIEATNFDLLGMIPDSHRNWFRQKLESSITHADQIEFSFPIQVKGSEKWLLNRSIQDGTDAHGNPIVLGVLIDISKEKKGEQKLAESERMLSKIYNSTVEFMVLLRVEEPNTFRIVSFNNKFIWGLKRMGIKVNKQEIVNLSIDSFHKKHAAPFGDLRLLIEQKMQEARDSKQQQYFKLEYFSLDQTRFCNSAITTPIMNNEGKCTHILYTVRDVTEIVEAGEKVTAAVIETEDKERHRIAREIHDSLGQNLTFASIQFRNLAQKIKQQYPELLQDIESGLLGLDQAIEESRNISYNLMPKAVDDFGFSLAVKGLIERSNKLGQTEFVFYSNMPADKRLDRQLERSMFRLVQESMNNILKHAEASNATIQCMEYEDSLNLTIEDDGKGFNVDEKYKSSQIGLRSMKNRVNSLGGVFIIESSPAKGCLIIASIPLAKNTTEHVDTNFSRR